MKYFKNTDGSFDVLNDNKVLFNFRNGTMKTIGRVNKKWKHPRKAIKSVPDEVFVKSIEIQGICL